MERRRQFRISTYRRRDREILHRLVREVVDANVGGIAQVGTAGVLSVEPNGARYVARCPDWPQKRKHQDPCVSSDDEEDLAGKFQAAHEGLEKSLKKIEHLELDKEVLQRSLMESEEKVDKLKDEVDALKEEVKELKRELKRSTGREKKLEEELSQLKDELSKLKEAFARKKE